MNAPSKTIMAWINKADHDLGSAKIIFLHLPDYFDTIAFHCQQAVEKYLKAILVYSDVEFERSHDLIYLLELLPEAISVADDKYKKAVILNGFSVQIRYPNTIEPLNRTELEQAISIAQEFRIFAMDILNIDEYIDI